MFRPIRLSAMPIMFAMVLTLILSATPTQGHAEEFFDSPMKVTKLVDGALSEGMISGHNGLILKTAHFMDQGATLKDAASKTAMNKIAWYSAVNAHRMLDALLPGIQNPDTKREMTKTLKFLDSGISLIGQRFGWNAATTKAMYQKTRTVIEARMGELGKTAFTS